MAFTGCQDWKEGMDFGHIYPCRHISSPMNLFPGMFWGHLAHLSHNFDWFSFENGTYKQSFTMSATQAFSAGLTRLGFDAPTCKLLVGQGTVASICDLTNFPFPEIDKMIQHLSRWKPKVVEDDDDDPVAGPTFPYISVWPVCQKGGKIMFPVCVLLKSCWQLIMRGMQ